MGKYDHCINCGMCTRNCVFLNKYGINLREYYDNHEDLAYHCFLCGLCYKNCPVSIDGREISLELRRKRLKKGFKLRRHGYSLLLFEKNNFIFKNYKKLKTKNKQDRLENIDSIIDNPSNTAEFTDSSSTAAIAGLKKAFKPGKSVIFPGCNFQSYFPETLAKISRIMDEDHDMATVYDCCHKPVYELGLDDDSDRLNSELNQRLVDQGVTELVSLCPNCYYHLDGRLADVQVTSIYDKIIELGIEMPEIDKSMTVFKACPDRYDLKLLGKVEACIGPDKVQVINDVQCCGAGGCASIPEPGLVTELGDGLEKYRDGTIHSYCATCAGTMANNFDLNTRHILCEIFDNDELPAKGINSLLNRAKGKYII